MTQVAIDLSRLPAPKVVEPLDFETILAAMKADLLSRDSTLDAIALESEPMAKVLEVCAYRELLLRQRVNDAARAVMLAYAIGADEDQLGGNYDVPRLTGESDMRFRPRIQQGFHKLAAAGPDGAYKQHALAVDPRIRDVSVISETDGSVTVTVLACELKPEGEVGDDDAFIGQAAFPDVAIPNGQAAVIAQANSSILLAVRAALNHRDVRPLTDSLIVRAPAVLTYSVEAILVLYPGPDTQPVLAQSGEDLDSYQASIRKLAYDVKRAGLYDALVVPGVQDVILNQPAMDIEVGPTEIAVCTGIAIGSREARDE